MHSDRFLSTQDKRGRLHTKTPSVSRPQENIFHNMHALLPWLKARFFPGGGAMSPAERGVYAGKLLRRDRPIRDPDDPLRAPLEDFPGEFYPDLIQGPTYIFSLDTFQVTSNFVQPKHKRRQPCRLNSSFHSAGNNLQSKIQHAASKTSAVSIRLLPPKCVFVRDSNGFLRHRPTSPVPFAVCDNLNFTTSFFLCVYFFSGPFRGDAVGGSVAAGGRLRRAARCACGFHPAGQRPLRDAASPAQPVSPPQHVLYLRRPAS